MALASGTQLGSYEISDLLGKGGMGEVYRARDTKLGREVAIKVLPSEFSQDAERLARLEREARMLAALNHPNIAAIYGLEQSDDTRFLVLELVEGDTLADQIKRGPIPIEDTLTLALQIAEALEAAHEKGVIHRDLKPANVKVTPAGKVKVLDFGLAKAFEGEIGDVNLSNSPTLSMQATQAGMILGTAAYMSPEQAKGHAVDKRTDVWALGALLYEMLSGRQAFKGDEVSEILASVLAREPDYGVLQANLSPRVQRLLRRCLEKDQKKRWQVAGDVRIEIEELLADPAGVLLASVNGTVVTSSQSMRLWVAAALVLAVVSGTIAWMVKPAPPAAPLRLSRWDHVLPEGLIFTNRNPIAISPDGLQFAYTAQGRLYLRRFAEREARIIFGTEQSFALANPTFSPDGESIAYWVPGAPGELMRIAVSGGAPVSLAPVPDNPFGIGWDVEGIILYGSPEGIMQVSANGGTPELLVAPVEGARQMGGPQFLPGANAVLFREGNGQVGVHVLDSGETRLLFAGSQPRYLPTGHIVYESDGVVLAVPFDLGTLDTTGGHVPLVAGEGVDDFVVSDSGDLIYVPFSGGGGRSLAWVDRNGGVEPIETIPPRDYVTPRLSPNRERVLISVDGNVHIYEIASGREIQVTSDGTAYGGYTEWDATGDTVAYSAARDDSGNVWVQLSDGSDTPAQKVTDLAERTDLDSWSPDGQALAVHRHGEGGLEDILMVNLADPAGEVQDFLVREFRDGGTVFSPDGRYVAYSSTESGRVEILISPYPGPGSQQPVSVGGGNRPVWTSSGELFYQSLTGDMMSVSVVTEPELDISPPRMVFEALAPVDLSAGSPRADYDVTEDGERFLMLVDTTTSTGRSRISVVENWFEELKERVPVP